MVNVAVTPATWCNCESTAVQLHCVEWQSHRRRAAVEASGNEKSYYHSLPLLSVNSHSHPIAISQRFTPIPVKVQIPVPIPSRSLPEKNGLNMCFNNIMTLQSTASHFTLQEMSLQIATQEQQGVQLIKSQFNCIYDLIQTLQEWFDQTVWYDTDFVESSHKADGNLHVQYIPISSHSHSNSCEKGFTFLFSWDPWEFPNLAHLYAAVESRSRPSCNRCTTGYNSFCSARSMLDNNRFLSTVRRIHKLWHGFRLFPSALSQSLITAMNFLLPLGGVYTAKRQ